MRPYMLWLARVYGRSITGYGTAFMAWPNVLDDWLRRCAEDRWRRDSYPRLEPRGPWPDMSPVGRSCISTGIRPPAVGLPVADRRARAAGQGER